ncbi:hypothetical protein HMPREF1502_1410 [Klebsiella sp. AS10]|nr:hypothetical protein HMPREF1502_1410 [Klebsiella sp. AS10]
MTSPSPPLRKANNPDASNAFQPAGRAAFDLAFFHPSLANKSI